MVGVAVALLLVATSGSYASELGLSLSGELAKLPGFDSRDGTAGLGITMLPGRVVDDDTPLSLQPYLQRASAVGMAFSATGFSTQGTGPVAGTFSGNTLVAGLDGDAYLGGLFTLRASAALGRSGTLGARAPSEYWLPRASLAPGLRFGDARFELGYRYAPTIANGKYDGRGWGELFLRATHVAARSVRLVVEGDLILHGASAGVTLNLYPVPTFQIGGSLSYAEGAIYFDTDRVYRRWRPGVDISWWFTRRSRIELEYTFEHTAPVNPDVGLPVDGHRLTLGLLVRFG